MIFTGEWSLPVREAEATNALVDAGCDVITCHVDSPKVVIETAEGRGVKTCGHNASQAPLAPKGFITGAEYKWETIYKAYADGIADGEPLPNFLVGGYNNDMLRNTPYGAGATPEAIAAADAAIAALKAGKPIYKGPLKDNTGNVVVDKDLRQLRPLPRRHELPARGRARARSPEHGLRAQAIRPARAARRRARIACAGSASGRPRASIDDRRDRRRHRRSRRRATSDPQLKRVAETIVDPDRSRWSPRRCSSRSSCSSSARTRSSSWR